MAGRKSIIVGEITQSSVKGDALGAELFKELNQSELGSTYEKTDVAKHEKSKK